MLHALALTISDGCSNGTRIDTSGPLLVSLLELANYSVTADLLPDEQTIITERLRQAIRDKVDLAITTGGTGFSPRDITPEATTLVIERHAPGLAEMLRSESYPAFPTSVLSRGVAGIAGTTLIINLPGSNGGVRDGMKLLAPLLPHAHALLRDEPVDHELMAHTKDTPPAKIICIEANIDDMSPELYQSVMEHLFDLGSLDVFLTPIQMKKGRPGTQLSVLSPVSLRSAIVGALFTHTSTFGVRYSYLDRETLDRAYTLIVTKYGDVRMKVGTYAGREVGVAAEYADVRAIAKTHGIAEKVVLIEAMKEYEALKSTIPKKCGVRP